MNERAREIDLIADPTTDYARAVCDGKILMGPLVRLACKRHVDDLEHGAARGLAWDPGLALLAFEFFERLTLADGAHAGQPFTLEPWQKFIVGSLYGWLGDDGYRRFRTAFIEVGKGNGKTPMAAAIGLKGLVADGEPGAEVYSAAVSQDQASICFRDARRFVEASAALLRRITITENNLAYVAGGSFMRPVSSERRTLDGKRVHIGLADEVHEHPTPMVVDKLRAGTKGRRQPMIVEITNALALDTPIPMPSGWTTMGEIQAGDHVFDEQGQPCRVTEVSTIFENRQCHRVVLDEGSEIVADAGHLWQTRQRWSCRSRADVVAGAARTGGRFITRGSRAAVGVRTTEEIRRTIRYQNFANHSIAVAGALDLPEAQLPVDPYTLGCWLGDGNSKDTGLVVADGDRDILNSIMGAGVTIGPKRPVGRKNEPIKGLGLYRLGTRGRGRQDSLHCILKREGLIRNKHIPIAYLRGSISQRLALLQGLLDTDGHISPRSGRCVFTQHRRDMILQVAELVISLGVKCTVLQSQAALRGKVFDRWDVFFYPPWNMPVFRLRRKLRHHRVRHRRRRMSASRFVVDVQPAPSVPVRCITVDSASRLFLAGRSMIPTHNSGYDRNSVCWLHHEQSRKILEGHHRNDTWFAYVCDLDPDDDWQKDEACWPKANPNLGVSITRKYLRELVDEAREMPSRQNIVARLNFCVWTGQATRWLDMKAWDECGEPVVPDALKGRACFGGLDLSVLIDVTALCWVFPPLEESERWKYLWRFWLPKDRIDKRVQRDNVNYDVWVRDGILIATPGNVVDYAWIRKAIQEDGERFLVQEIAYDRFNASQIVTWLQDDGFTMVPHGQGFVSMSGPSKEFEKMVVGRQMAHGNNPCARWMASNVAVRQDPAGNIKPDRVSSTERIDGIVAAVMATGRATLVRDDAVPGYSV